MKDATFHLWGRPARGAGVHAAHGYDKRHVTVRSTTGAACRECEACTGLQKDAMATKEATCNPAYQCAGVRVHLTAAQLLKRGGTRARRHDVVHRCSDKVASCNAHACHRSRLERKHTANTHRLAHLISCQDVSYRDCTVRYIVHGPWQRLHHTKATQLWATRGGSGEAEVAPSSHMSWLPAGDAIRAGCADVIPGDLC